MKEDARRITQTALTPALGTPDYISPEQVKGQRGDQRSDIYALGAMLYEMLTGQPPFTGPNPLAVMNERVLTDPKPARELNPEISPELEEILFRALERDPRHRYSTAAEMAWELEHQELVGVDDGERRPSLRSAAFGERPQAGALCGAGAGSAGVVCGDAAAGAALIRIGILGQYLQAGTLLQQRSGAAKPRTLAAAQVSRHGAAFCPALSAPTGALRRCGPARQGSRRN